MIFHSVRSSSLTNWNRYGLCIDISNRRFDSNRLTRVWTRNLPCYLKVDSDSNFFVTSRQFACFLDRIFTRRWFSFPDGTRLQVVSVEIEVAARVKWVISSEYRREGFHCRCHAAARHWPWHSRDIRAEIQWNIATKPSESGIVGDWSK